MLVGETLCGIAIPQTNSPVDVGLIRRFLKRADELSYESVWVQEQILDDSPILEPVTLLTYGS
jgi:alkanesulfonate monooxygenase SsuD/methylene tetrahydromethanopterin reductase-like flavin-dependent oxidoreductase (luciferase family)